MKKLANYLICLAIMSFASSCDKKETTPEPQVQPTPEIKEYSLVGVWRSGNYFVSIDSDNFLSAYIAPKFIECGTITKEDKVFTCKDSYLNTTTKYTITSLDEKTMKLSISYQEVEGEQKTTSLTLEKSSDTPAVKDNSLIGHSFTYRQFNYYTTMDFNTYSTGKMANTKSNIKDVPLTIHYIFLGDKLYFQRFNPEGGRIAIIKDWNDNAGDGTLTVFQFFYEENKISWHDDVTETSL